MSVDTCVHTRVTLVRGMSVGRLIPSSESNLFSSSERTRVAAFLSECDDGDVASVWSLSDSFNKHCMRSKQEDRWGGVWGVGWNGGMGWDGVWGVTSGIGWDGVGCGVWGGVGWNLPTSILISDVAFLGTWEVVGVTVVGVSRWFLGDSDHPE